LSNKDVVKQKISHSNTMYALVIALAYVKQQEDAILADMFVKK